MPDDIIQPTVITPGQPAASPPEPAAPMAKKIAITDGDAPTPAFAAVPAQPAPEPPRPPGVPTAPVAEATAPPDPIAARPAALSGVQMTGALTSPPRPGDVPKFGELQPKIDAHPLFSGAKEPAPKRPRRGMRRLMGLVGFLLAAAIALYLLIDAGVVRGASHLPFHIFKQPVATTTPTISSIANANTLQRTTYTNNKGDKFSILFYMNPVTKAVPNSTDNGIELTSAVSIPGKYPLIFFIESNSASDQTAQALYNQYKNCFSSAPLVLSAYNDYFRQTISTCNLPISNAPSGTNVMYIAFFETSSKIYTATFSQDVDWKTVLASPQAAAIGLSKIGVQAYDNDIKTILASVRAL